MDAYHAATGTEYIITHTTCDFCYALTGREELREWAFGIKLCPSCMEEQNEKTRRTLAKLEDEQNE